MTGIAEMVLRLVLGALLGGIIGFERYTHGRPAGFRTHIIVCVASVLIMMVSVDFHYLSKQNPDYIKIDPSRITNINYEYDRMDTIFNYTFTISVDDREDLRGLLAKHSSIDGISRVSIKG
jgi:uncharacterized membrane protein YhiD involved in acid resistance